jgi:hypothetical protein
MKENPTTPTPGSWSVDADRHRLADARPARQLGQHARPPVLLELQQQLELRSSAAAGWSPLGQGLGLHRRRRHPRIHHASKRNALCELITPRPAHLLAPRGAALSHRRGDPRLCARRRAGTGAGLPLPHRRRRQPPGARAARSAAGHASRVSAARCARAAARRARRRWSLMLTGKPVRADHRALASSAWSTAWSRGRARSARDRSSSRPPPPHRPPFAGAAAELAGRARTAAPGAAAPGRRRRGASTTRRPTR